MGTHCLDGISSQKFGWSPNRDLSHIGWWGMGGGGRLVKFYNILRLHVYILSVELKNLRWVRESLRSWVDLTLTNGWFAFGQYNKRTSNRHIRRDTCKLYRGLVSRTQCWG